MLAKLLLTKLDNNGNATFSPALEVFVFGFCLGNHYVLTRTLTDARYHLHWHPVGPTKVGECNSV